ncbi:hypothetical protein Tco_0712742, partial [Tanacetum coccineum]
NANPFVPVPPNGLHARITQELNELRAILAMIDSHPKNIDHTRVTMPPNEIDMDDLESKDELIDTPLVSPFLDPNDEKFIAYFDLFLLMNIITRKAYNTIMVEGLLKSTGRNLVAIVRDVYVFVGSFTYVTDFVVLEDIWEFIVMFSFWRHLDELHVTWAHLEKKRTRLRTNIQDSSRCAQQSRDGVTSYTSAVINSSMTASHHLKMASDHTNSNTDL